MKASQWTMVAFAFLTVVSVVAFVMIMVLLDPAHADGGSFAVLYLSVFTAVSGIGAWTLMAMRARLPKVKRPMHYFFSDAFRQGMLVGMIVSLNLFLQARRSLTLLWVLLIVTLAFAIEMYATRSVRAAD